MPAMSGSSVPLGAGWLARRFLDSSLRAAFCCCFSCFARSRARLFCVGLDFCKVCSSRPLTISDNSRRPGPPPTPHCSCRRPAALAETSGHASVTTIRRPSSSTSFRRLNRVSPLSWPLRSKTNVRTCRQGRRKRRGDRLSSWQSAAGMEVRSTVYRGRTLDVAGIVRSAVRIALWQPDTAPWGRGAVPAKHRLTPLGWS